MTSQVIIKSSLGLPPEEDVQFAINNLGDSWRVVQASTDVFVFEGSEMDRGGPLRHTRFVTTVVLEKVLLKGKS